MTGEYFGEVVGTAESARFGPCKVLFRRISGRVRITLFEGGHDLLPGPAFGWLERQKRNAEPIWESGDFYDIKPTELTK